MTGLRLKMENLFQNIERCESETEAMIADIREIASGIDQDINFLAWELRPTELENVGIEAALSSFVNEWSRQYNIRAEFNSNPQNGASERANPDIETNLYRFLQEALNNVLKHSEASFVSIVFDCRDGEIVLAIEDDGRGFDPEDIPAHGQNRRRIGLTGMRERILHLNGSLEIDSTPGQGTRLLARVPFVPAADQHGNGSNGNVSGDRLVEPKES